MGDQVFKLLTADEKVVELLHENVNLTQQADALRTKVSEQAREIERLGADLSEVSEAWHSLSDDEASLSSRLVAMTKARDAWRDSLKEQGRWGLMYVSSEKPDGFRHLRGCASVTLDRHSETKPVTGPCNCPAALDAEADQ